MATVYGRLHFGLVILRIIAFLFTVLFRNNLSEQLCHVRLINPPAEPGGAF
jgi:hypothetical protein